MTTTAGGPAGIVRVRRAGVDDVPRLARVLVDAFVDTPQARWLIPDKTRRQDVYQRLCPDLLAQAMTAGTVHTTVDRAAAALWLAYPVARTTTDRQAARLRRITGRHADRFLQLAGLLHTHAPRQPHTYLAYLAVAPPASPATSSRPARPPATSTYATATGPPPGTRWCCPTTGRRSGRCGANRTRPARPPTPSPPDDPARDIEVMLTHVIFAF
ncbi:hypothetical protein [Micromonospora sp. LOL_023]|uniref:hypothetical protein n=1 Tax=Micromonospora sp. LOL_023 TaxID=3345418 RepID=UPI003A8C4A07